MIIIDWEGAAWDQIATIRVRGRPIVKKNSKKPVVDKAGKTHLLCSKAFEAWEKAAVWEVMAAWRATGRFAPVGGPEQPVWLWITYYMPPGGWADLSNLYEGIQDVMRKAGVLTDDRWVRSHDRSRVLHAATKAEACLVARVLVPR